MSEMEGEDPRSFPDSPGVPYVFFQKFDLTGHTHPHRTLGRQPLHFEMVGLEES